MRRETFEFGDLVRLIIEILRYSAVQNKYALQAFHLFTLQKQNIYVGHNSCYVYQCHLEMMGFWASVRQWGKVFTDMNVGWFGFRLHTEYTRLLKSFWIKIAEGIYVIWLLRWFASVALWYRRQISIQANENLDHWCRCTLLAPENVSVEDWFKI